MRRAAFGVSVALVIAMLVAGCDLINSDSGLGRIIVIENGTSETLQILSVISDGTESKLITLEPEQQYRIRANLYVPDRCYPTPLVARRSDGTEVARYDGRLCSGDTWVVEG